MAAANEEKKDYDKKEFDALLREAQIALNEVSNKQIKKTLANNPETLPQFARAAYNAYLTYLNETLPPQIKKFNEYLATQEPSQLHTYMLSRLVKKIIQHREELLGSLYVKPEPKPAVPSAKQLYARYQAKKELEAEPLTRLALPKRVALMSVLPRLAPE